MLNQPPSGLWDSFWAEHSSNNSLFHQLLWRIRFLFSYAYAQELFRMPRPAVSDQRILEIGCGSARTLHYLSRRLPQSSCFAFDLSPQALKLVQQISPQFVLSVSDAKHIPLDSQSVAVSFSIGLIEHFDREVAGEMVREMARIAEPDGVVAVMVPWRSSFYNLIRLAFGTRWPFGHENPFRRGELVKFMQAQGLHNVRLHVIYFSTLLAIGSVPQK